MKPEEWIGTVNVFMTTKDKNVAEKMCLMEIIDEGIEELSRDEEVL